MPILRQIASTVVPVLVCFRAIGIYSSVNFDFLS